MLRAHGCARAVFGHGWPYTRWAGIAQKGCWLEYVGSHLVGLFFTHSSSYNLAVNSFDVCELLSFNPKESNQRKSPGMILNSLAGPKDGGQEAWNKEVARTRYKKY